MVDEIELQAAVTHQQASVAWRERLLAVLASAGLPLSQGTLLGVSALLAASAKRGHVHALGYPEPRLARNASFADFTDPGVLIIGAREILRLARLIDQIDRNDSATFSRLVARAGRSGHAALTEADLIPPPDPSPAQPAAPAPDLSGLGQDLRTAALFHNDPRAIRALLAALDPEATRVVMHSAGLDLMRMAVGRTFQPERVTRAETWFTSIAGTVNPRLDLAHVREGIGRRAETDFGGVRGFSVATYGAGLLDEAAAFGQFDLVHTFGRGFDILSDGLGRGLDRWIGTAPGIAEARLDVAENASDSDLGGAVGEAVRGNADDYLGQLGRQGLDGDGLFLRGGLAEDFGNDAPFTPGRSAYFERLADAGVDLSRARARLAELGAEGYRMRGDEGAFPIATQAELNMRRGVNTVDFTYKLGKRTFEFANDMVGLSRYSSLPGMTVVAVGVAAWEVYEYTTDVVELSEQAKEEADDIAREQERLDAFTEETQEPDNTTSPPPAPPPDPDADPDANDDPDLAGTDPGGVSTGVVCEIDPMFAPGTDTVPVEIGLERLRAKLLSNITLLPEDYIELNSNWRTPFLAQQKLAIAVLSLIYPPPPWAVEDSSGGLPFGRVSQNDLVSDPPPPQPGDDAP